MNRQAADRQMEDIYLSAASFLTMRMIILKRIFTAAALCITLCAATNSAAQEQLRPYEKWETTQFVALSGHQPIDYVTADNNWEITYNLRTPQTAGELRGKGIPCSDSQLMLLEVGGIIEKTGGKWHTAIPILDKRQTDSLRIFSKTVTDDIYGKNKQDFITLANTIKDMGWQANTLSLMFSYLLDGRMWTKLLLFDDAGQHATWSGCYWILYEPRRGTKYGTNGYGEQDLCLTYIDSGIAPSPDTMDECADEIRRNGKITDAVLAEKLAKYGMVDAQGNALFPIIRRQDDAFHQTVNRLTENISTALKGYCCSMSLQFGIKEEAVATVALYHEVMWELMDRMEKDRIFTMPGNLKDSNKRGDGISNLVFYVEEGLMQ